jgi:hypothetical protein
MGREHKKVLKRFFVGGKKFEAKKVTFYEGLEKIVAGFAKKWP